MFDIQMEATARALVAHGKGILAADESTGNATLCCMRRTVPAAVPGLVFLSGGQSDVHATEHLNAMNQANTVPWELSFSFGRALQAPALKAWAGLQANETSPASPTAPTKLAT